MRSGRVLAYPSPVPGLSEIVFLLLFLTFLVPAIQRRMLATRRFRAIRGLEQRGRVITLIHRQESVSLLGIPLRRFIDIEDSEQVLRAVRLTPDTVLIDLVVHSLGGLVLASEQIARALHRHPAKVTVIVPHYAMSGGTMLALSADEILMDDNAVLGPVDPQIGQAGGLDREGGRIEAGRTGERRDADPRRHRKEGASPGEGVRHERAARRLSEDRAQQIADALTSGQWTHDYRSRSRCSLRSGCRCRASCRPKCSS